MEGVWAAVSGVRACVRLLEGVEHRRGARARLLALLHLLTVGTRGLVLVLLRLTAPHLLLVLLLLGPTAQGNTPGGVTSWQCVTPASAA